MFQDDLLFDHLTVLGNSIDQNAPVVGQICSR
jgi:ABC-type uncharacterized transport system YnjBCD ATPase subunit